MMILYLVAWGVVLVYTSFTGPANFIQLTFSQLFHDTQPPSKYAYFQHLHIGLLRNGSQVDTQTHSSCETSVINTKLNTFGCRSGSRHGSGWLLKFVEFDRGGNAREWHGSEQSRVSCCLYGVGAGMI
jgi:hypothetical protein